MVPSYQQLLVHHGELYQLAIQGHYDAEVVMAQVDEAMGPFGEELRLTFVVHC
jgi:hypothetical protein